MAELDNIKRLIEDKHVQFRDFNIGKVETREGDDEGQEQMIIKGRPVVFDSETLICK